MSNSTAWDALRAIATNNRRHPTLHSLIVYPDRGRLDLAFTAWEDKVVPAPVQQPTAIRFEQLFAPSDTMSALSVD